MLQYELKGFKQVYKLNQGHDKEIDRERVVPQWKQLDAHKTIPGGPSISLFLCPSSTFPLVSPSFPTSSTSLSSYTIYPVKFFLFAVLICLLFLCPSLSFSVFTTFWFFSHFHVFSLSISLCMNPHSTERQERGKMMCDSCYISIFCQWD